MKNIILNPESFIKGKIVETIFELMFEENHQYVVIRNGYEYKTPELAQSLSHPDYRETIAYLRNAPDFVLISREGKGAYLVEVKFRSNIDMEKLIETATGLNAKYGQSYIFLATHDKFYFESCKDIMDNHSITKELPIEMVPKELQEKYMKLLNEFIVAYKKP